MFGWLKALFLDEKARKAVEARARAKAVAASPAAAPPMTPKRALLIKDAMAVHKAKRKILDDLSDEDRARLVAMAITTLLNEGREPETKTETKKKKK